MVAIAQCSGDEALRQSYSAALLRLVRTLGMTLLPQHVLDLGCSTGLSSRELLRVFPAAHITAVDLSPHFLAVARFQQRQACLHLCWFSRQWYTVMLHCPVLWHLAETLMSIASKF